VHHKAEDLAISPQQSISAVSERSAAGSESSLTQRAYNELRDALLDCRFEPGEPLRIGELCKQFKASQGAIREALSRLTSEGLVQARPQRGFRVTPISAEDLRDLTAARIEIEELCLRHAIAAGDLRWEARIIAAFHQLSRTPPLAPGTPRRFDRRFVALHHSFFDDLVSSCGSLWLARVRQMLQIQEMRYHGRSPPPAPGERDLIGELRELMEAVIARDSDRACRLLASHMRRSAEVLIAQMSR
jgi:DNA-binding GntR family transcriptional regulator